MTHARSLMLTVAASLVIALTCSDARADQPRLGFDGDLVKLPSPFGNDYQTTPSGKPIRGIRVNRANWGSPAARMGLERGDIIVTIDNIAFSSWDGYYAALRMASQKPSVLLINVRTGRGTRVDCRLPHTRSTSGHSDTMGLAIDLVEDMRGH